MIYLPSQDGTGRILLRIKLNYMNKQILRLWILERLDKLTSKLTDLETSIDHALYVTSPQQMLDRCNEIRGEEKILKELYNDFNLEEVSKEEIQYH